MIDRILQIHLEPIVRDQLRWRRLRELTFGWAALAALGWLLVLIHARTGWGSGWLFLLLLLAAIGWSFAAMVRHRRLRADLRMVARKIETENPELHAVLLTAVEQQRDRETGELNYLQERVIREALAQDRQSQWRRRESGQLWRMRVANVTAAAVLAVAFVQLHRAAPLRVALLTATGRAVSVTPGDTSVEKGTSLVVLAKFEGEVPSKATLVVRPANEPERRIPLKKNLDDPVFGTSVPEVKAELTYRVEYDDDQTRDYRVTVFEFPRLERADARVSYPEYTGIPEKTIEDTRRVSAVEGSALEYTFHLNKPVKAARLVPKEGNQIPLQADTNRPNVYVSNFQLASSGRYQLMLVDDAGRTNKLPPLFVLEALSNRVPDIKFAFPRGDQRVSALEEISFKAEAVDDFGLKGYGIAYNIAGEDQQFIELGGSAGPLEKRSLDHLVALEKLGAEPDQLLSYYLWADDIGPDGTTRRTASDMFFAEVRPFEEIFREGQPQDPNSSEQQQQQQPGQQGQNQAEQLAELQKQIITATWNLQRREINPKPTEAFKADADTIKESQENALEQVRSRREQVEDPRASEMLVAAEEAMEKAAKELGKAVSDNSASPLPTALSSEQSAYQALLRLAAREYQVSQGGNRGQQRGQNSRGSRAQRQLDQLDLRQSQNRYETERQASTPMNEQQREQLRSFNRLKELAQRQQDVNERLRELQTALQEARTETEREELRRQLKRLQEEQQQMLADLDELRQQLDRQENQSDTAEARQRMDETRNEVQRAAEAMERGEVAQALNSGTRAQRDLQDLRDEFRRQSSSQFSEEMRELRSQARELAERQEQIGTEMEELNRNTNQKALTDSEERKELASQLQEQKQRMDELIKNATEVTQEAEAAEPLLARQLYDTLRQVSQDQTRDLQQTSDDLLAQGRLYRNVEERLREARRNSENPVQVASEFLQRGLTPEASNLEQRARRSINELRDGVERAAQSVLGDDTEALRLARAEVDELSRQLEQEIARARSRADTNQPSGQLASASRPGNQTDQPGEQDSEQPTGQRQQSGQQAGNESPQDREGQQAQSEQSGQGNRQGQNGDQAQQQAQNGQQGQGGQQGQRGEDGQRRDGGDQNQQQQRDAGGQVATANRGGGGGGASFLDQLGDPNDARVNSSGDDRGPFTGGNFTDWSNRLRDVEDMLDVPELRAEAARIRDRARVERQEARHSTEPRWDLVEMEIAGPLLQLRTRISEELARRESKDAVVPLDRDPVPSRYAELVRRYYEELGKSKTATPPQDSSFE